MSERGDNISELRDKSGRGGATAAGEPPTANPPAADPAGGHPVAGDLIDVARLAWARELPDLDTSPMAIIARLGRVTAYLDAAVNARLGEFGLTRAAWDVLASLRRQGAPYRLSPTALYLGLMRSSGAMTHRLRRLEHAGLVRRVADPDDARGMLVELTAAGIELTGRIAPVHMDNERRLLSSLGTAEQQTLAELLRTMLIALESHRPVPPPSGRGGRRRRAC